MPSPTLTYERVKRRKLNGLILQERSYAAGLKMPKHSHEKSHFYFVLEGMITDVCGKVTRTSEPSSLLFQPAGESHSNHFHNPVRLFEIYLEPYWLDRVGEHSQLLDDFFHFQTGPLIRLAHRLYTEFQEEDTLAPLAMEGLMLEILIGTCRHATNLRQQKPPRWLRQARNLLHNQFMESLSLGDIAQAVGIHPAHLARMFRQQYHCSIGEYLRDLRLEHASHLLSTSNDSLAEIALSVGYSDQSHFSTAFKRHTNLTPAEFRRIFSRR